MAFIQLSGEGPYWPTPQIIQSGNSAAKLDTAANVIDATGEKIAMCGRVWTPNRATKSIRKVGLLFASVTKAGGSALTLSLQDVSLTAGPPIQPDETQDQTVAIANANATFLSNTWHLTAALSADRSVAFGELLSVVLEFDGAGMLGADTVAITAWNSVSTTLLQRQSRIAHKTAGAWAMLTDSWPILFEFSDGTFGCFSGVNCPVSAVNTIPCNTGTSPDEYAQRIVPTIPMKVDGAYVEVHAAAGADFDVVLYDGTTAMTGGTVTVDSNAIDSAAVYRITHVTFPQEIELVAGGVYYLAVKPTTANSLTIPVLDVAAAGHLAVHPGGIEWYAAHRVDAGAWTLVTTRRLFAGLRISSLDGGTLTAVEIRAAVGLAAANLDTQLAAIQAAAADVYHAEVSLAFNDTAMADRYTVAWLKNGVRITSGITLPKLQVVKSSDGTDLIAAGTAMTEIASTAMYRYDATGAERMAAGAISTAIATATIDGGVRNFPRVVTRDLVA